VAVAWFMQGLCIASHPAVLPWQGCVPVTLLSRGWDRQKQPPRSCVLIQQQPHSSTVALLLLCPSSTMGAARALSSHPWDDNIQLCWWWCQSSASSVRWHSLCSPVQVTSSIFSENEGRAPSSLQ